MKAENYAEQCGFDNPLTIQISKFMDSARRKRNFNILVSRMASLITRPEGVDADKIVILLAMFGYGASDFCKPAREDIQAFIKSWREAVAIIKGCYGNI